MDGCFDHFILKVPAIRDVSGFLDRKKILQEYTLLEHMSAHHRFTIWSQLSERNTYCSQLCAADRTAKEIGNSQYS